MAGADFPGCAVTYDIERDWLILWVPHSDPRTVLWYGKTPTPKEFLDASEVDEVRDISSLNRTLFSLLEPGTTVYVLRPDQAPPVENTKGTLRLDTTMLKPAIETARVTKTDYEIALIKRANAISVRVHSNLPPSLLPHSPISDALC